MATTVTALMYSGLEDPSWELTPEQEANLEHLFGAEKEVTFEQSALSFGLLGYRGFIIETKKETEVMPYKLFCFDGIIDTADQTSTNFIDKGSELESFLLDTGKGHLNEIETGFISAEISKNASRGPASINKSFELLAVPPFNPGKWNNDPNVRRRNNCYNYANDKITNTFAQPGRGSGLMFSALECGNVSSAAQRDGQKVSSKPSTTPAQGHYIALVVAPNYDYHWYRLDSNGMWSHKPGQTPAKNTDNAGRLISDPENCSRYPYTDFCGYFHCIPSQTTIR